MINATIKKKSTYDLQIDDPKLRHLPELIQAKGYIAHTPCVCVWRRSVQKHVKPRKWVKKRF